MKWTNNYDLDKWNDLMEKISSYKMEAEPTSDGNKMFADGLRMFNMISFKGRQSDGMSIQKTVTRDPKSWERKMSGEDDKSPQVGIAWLD